MKQILRFKVLLLLMLTGLFCVNAAPVSTLAEMRDAPGGELTITAEHPIYVLDVDDGYYMLYDGTAGIFSYDGEGYFSSIKKGNSLTAGTLYFGYSSYMGYTPYKAPTDLTIVENGTIADPMELPEVVGRFERGTYFKAKGTISAVDGGYKFAPENGDEEFLEDYFNVSPDYSALAGKTGMFTGVVTGLGTINKYSPLTANFFEAEGEGPGDAKTFRELLTTTGNYDYATITMPENAQVLQVINTNSLIVWDGETGLLFYSGPGNATYISNYDYESDGYIEGYTGYAISGAVDAQFEYEYWDFYNPEGTLTLGEKQEVVPKEVTGAQAKNEDKSNLFAYVKMHGKMENQKFIADDGTEFNVNEVYENGVLDKEGEGTIKALVYANSSYGEFEEFQLYPIEKNAWTADGDEPGPEPGGDAKTFKELLTTTPDKTNVDVVMPENAQILRIINNSMYVWNGETGIQIYAGSGGHFGYITNFDYDSDAFLEGYTGYTVSGTVNAEFESDYWDFYDPTGSLTVGEKAPLTPREMTGAEAISEDRLNLYSYAKMHGKLEDGKFISDDNTEFSIDDTYVDAGVANKEGAGTLVGMVSNGWNGNTLCIFENNAWTADQSGYDFDAPVMSLAEIKAIDEFKDIRFKFEEDKVVMAAVVPSEGWDQIYLWDGQDGMFLNGDVLSNAGFEAKAGHILNGGFVASYQGSSSNQLYYNPTYFADHEEHITLGAEKEITPIRKTAEELHATAYTKTFDFSYVAVEGTIENGRLVSGDVELSLMNFACPDVDLNKYDGQTGTFYGIYQATNGEYLLPINENYFQPKEEVVYQLETLADLNAAEEAGKYNMTLPAGSNYKVQLLAYNSGIAYLWDGQDGAIVFDENETIPADKVGAFLTGNVKFNLTNNSDVIEYLIDASSVEFTEVEDFLPAVEKTAFEVGDFVKIEATLQVDETDGTVYFTLNGEDYILVEDLVAFGVEPAELNGKKGTLTAIYTGMNMLSIYPDAWFVESTPESISLATVTEEEAARGIYTIDGRYVGNSLKNLTKGIYVVGGRKVAVK